MKQEVIVTVVVPASRSWPEHLGSAAGAVLALLAVPIAVFAIGLPVVLLARSVIELAVWIAARFGG